jgi:methyl-accepting chemotaxis protein
MSDKYEARERTIASLKFRITLMFVFFLTAIFAVFVITSAMEANTVITFFGTRLALPAVEKVQALIDGDRFEALSISLDDTDPYYEEIRRQLEFIKSNAGCKNLYTMTPVNDKIYRFIIDGSAPPDDEENFSPIGSEEDVSDYEPAFFETAWKKEVLLGSMQQSDLWGHLICAYGPIVNSQGKVVGVIGSDLDASSIVAWIRSRIFWQLGIIVIFIAFGLIVYLRLLRKLDRIYQQEM